MNIDLSSFFFSSYFVAETFLKNDILSENNLLSFTSDCAERNINFFDMKLKSSTRKCMQRAFR